MGLTNEQIQVINHGKGNILVSASAGSGKTYTMVSRLIRLITEDNISVSQILAVTFTEAAATDMKEKLRKEISKKIAKETDEKVKKRLVSELGEIPCADISTIHAFCARLIRRYFFTVEVSPDFKIADDGEASILRNECINKTFKEFYDNGEQWFLKLVDRYATGRKDDQFKEYVLNLYKFCAQEAEPEKFLDSCLYHYTEEGLTKVLSTIKDKLNEQLQGYVDTLYGVETELISLDLKKGAEFTRTLRQDIDCAISSSDLFALKKYENYKLRLDFERNLEPIAEELKNKASNVRTAFVKAISSVTKALSNNFKEELEMAQSVGKHTEWIIRVVKKFIKIYSENKREENLLDFNDLEHFALKILCDESVCEEVKNKYEYLFIDEYQDTNGVQEEIITRLENNNLFMVGDVKQSIYGFRGCRSEFFTKKEHVMSEKGEKVIRLNANFRSADEIIKFVNLVFCHAMTKKAYGEDYKSKAQLISGGIYPKDAVGRAKLHFFKLPEHDTETKVEKPRVYDPFVEDVQIDDDNATFFSDRIACIIEQELGKTYYDTKEEKYKKVNYGDVAILTRNRNNKFVNDLVSGLIRHGIPVTSEVEVNVCDYPEIKTLINLLKLIDCFAQDLPLASTLKSPIANLTDEELYSIARFYEDAKGRDGKGFYTAYEYYVANAQSELSIRLKEFNEYVDRARFLADFIGAGGILKRIVWEKDFKSYFFAGRGGKEKVNRLNRFIAATEVNGKALTVKEFLERIENCPEVFGLSYFTGENTVKTMTIHASKGLEFPVVIVCGTERNFNIKNESAEILAHRGIGIATKFYEDTERCKKETSLRTLVKMNMREELIKEEMRLFYVALTRATYSLHVTFSGDTDPRLSINDTQNSFIKFIPSSLPVSEFSDEILAFSSLGRGERKVLIGSADSNLTEVMKKRINYQYPYESDTRLPLKQTVTAAAERGKEDGEYVYVMFDEETTDNEKGIIAHKILENFDFNKLDDFDGVISAELQNGVVTEKELSSINLERIKKVLRADVFNKLIGKKLYTEKSFLVNVDACKVLNTESKEQVLLQGIIDLLVVGDNEALVIDYKYSALNGESLVKKYQKQIELYSYAVEKVLKIPVKEKIIINLFTGDIVNIT